MASPRVRNYLTLSVLGAFAGGVYYYTMSKVPTEDLSELQKEVSALRAAQAVDPIDNGVAGDGSAAAPAPVQDGDRA